MRRARVAPVEVPATVADREAPLPGRAVSRAAQWHGERRLPFALEAAQTGIFDWHVPTGKTIYIAPARDRRGGPLYREVSAEESRRNLHPRDRARVRSAVERFLAGETETFDVTHRTRASGQMTHRGGWVHVAVHGRALTRDKGGRPLRVLGVFRNVTEEVSRQAAVASRAAGVANATRLAAVGELALVLEHELNQPLAALSAYVQASMRLVESGEGGRRRTLAALRRCVALAERASEILKSVRRLVRRMPGVEESFDLRDTVAEVAALLETDARHHDVAIRASRRGRAVRVRGDRVQVQLALFNLCRNAIEAVGGSTRRGIIRITAATDGGAAVARVADNGPGIPRRLVRKVFEPFISTKPDGSGLGLAISRSIAEAQGGSLRLERNGPRGATFALRLPRVEGRARATSK